MALEKSIPSNFGLTADYWRIVRVENAVALNQMVVWLAGYPSEEARRTIGVEPMMSANVTLAGADYKADATLAELYTWIKTQEAFAGAADA